MITSATGRSKPAKNPGLSYVAQYQSPRTQYEIRSTVKQFLEIVGRKPVELEAIDKAVELYFKQKRDYEQDVQKFFVVIALRKKGGWPHRIGRESLLLGLLAYTHVDES